MTDESSRQLAIMIFDNLRLAVPLSEVRSIERTADIQLAPDEQPMLGHLSHRGQHYPAYAFTSRLELLSQTPDSWLVCVCLGAMDAQIRLAIACEAVESVELDQSVVMQVVPDCMQSTDTPVRWLCKYNEHLVVISEVDALADYMTSYLV